MRWGETRKALSQPACSFVLVSVKEGGRAGNCSADLWGLIYHRAPFGPSKTPLLVPGTLKARKGCAVIGTTKGAWRGDGAAKALGIALGIPASLGSLDQRILSFPFR